MRYRLLNNYNKFKFGHQLQNSHYNLLNYLVSIIYCDQVANTVLNLLVNYWLYYLWEKHRIFYLPHIFIWVRYFLLPWWIVNCHHLGKVSYRSSVTLSCHFYTLLSPSPISWCYRDVIFTVVVLANISVITISITCPYFHWLSFIVTHWTIVILYS